MLHAESFAPMHVKQADQEYPVSNSQTESPPTMLSVPHSQMESSPIVESVLCSQMESSPVEVSVLHSQMDLSPVVPPVPLSATPSVLVTHVKVSTPVVEV
jgi:hypothetical protein